MNRLLVLLTIFMTLLCGEVAGRSPANEIEVWDIQAEMQDSSATISFTLNTGERATRNNYSLIITPQLKRDGMNYQLTPIVVQGRRAPIATRRHTLAGRVKELEAERRYYTSNDRSFSYSEELPFQEWMEGSELEFEFVNVGCSQIIQLETELIASNLFWAEPKIEYEVVKSVTEVPAPTTGEYMAELHPFIKSIGEYEIEALTSHIVVDQQITPRYNDLEREIDVDDSNSIALHFRVGSNRIERNYLNNNSTLVQLFSSIQTIDHSDDSRIAKIVIVGFASPEGAEQNNNKLAWYRAMALRQQLVQNTRINPAIIELQNGGEDWQGLRQLVEESTLAERQIVLDIIDNVPIWDNIKRVGRLGELMRLNSGDSYRYMQEYLFPKLRQATYVKIYYNNR